MSLTGVSGVDVSGIGVDGHRHVDNPNRNGRVLTAIFYLNENYNPETDGNNTLPAHGHSSRIGFRMPLTWIWNIVHGSRWTNPPLRAQKSRQFRPEWGMGRRRSRSSGRGASTEQAAPLLVRQACMRLPFSRPEPENREGTILLSHGPEKQRGTSEGMRLSRRCTVRNRNVMQMRFILHCCCGMVLELNGCARRVFPRADEMCDRGR